MACLQYWLSRLIREAMYISKIIDDYIDSGAISQLFSVAAITLARKHIWTRTLH